MEDVTGDNAPKEIKKVGAELLVPLSIIISGVLIAVAIFARIGND